MAIYRYTKAFQNAGSLKTKPEPWLHVGLEVQQEGLYIAVFVWDTRKVVEQRFDKFKNYAEYRVFASDFYRRKYKTANDNGKKLVGKGVAVDYFNKNIMTASASGNEAITSVEAAPVDLQVAPETVAKLMPMLKSAYAEEINAWYQYYIIAPFLVGKERTSVVADYAENGNEELKHASMLLERINQLGGDFTDIEALDKLDALAKAKYIKPTSTDVAVSLQQVVDAEKGAIETYTALEEASRDIDVVTNKLVKQILEDEQTHLQEALDFLADIA